MSPAGPAPTMPTCVRIPSHHCSFSAWRWIPHSCRGGWPWRAQIPAGAELRSSGFRFQVSDGFLVAPDSVFWTGNFEVSLGDDRGATYNAALFRRPPAGEWHYYAFVLDRLASPERQITPFVDGAAVAYAKPDGYASQPHGGHGHCPHTVYEDTHSFDAP